MKYNTKVSKCIKEYIDLSKDKSFSVHHLEDYLIEEGIYVNLSTIYRNLDQFVGDGLLIKFKAGHRGSYLYRINDEEKHCHSHLHLQCSKCGKTIHTKNDFMESLISRLENEYQFNIDCDISTISGLCFECKE